LALQSPSAPLSAARSPYAPPSVDRSQTITQASFEPAPLSAARSPRELVPVLAARSPQELVPQYGHTTALQRARDANRSRAALLSVIPSPHTPPSTTMSSFEVAPSEKQQEEEKPFCSICQETINSSDGIIFCPKGDIFHSQCIVNMRMLDGPQVCPNCRASFFGPENDNIKQYLTNNKIKELMPNAQLMHLAFQSFLEINKVKSVTILLQNKLSESAKQLEEFKRFLYVCYFLDIFIDDDDNEKLEHFRTIYRNKKTTNYFIDYCANFFLYNYGRKSITIGNVYNTNIIVLTGEELKSTLQEIADRSPDNLYVFFFYVVETFFKYKKIFDEFIELYNAKITEIKKELLADTIFKKLKNQNEQNEQNEWSMLLDYLLDESFTAIRKNITRYMLLRIFLRYFFNKEDGDIIANFGANKFKFFTTMFYIGRTEIFCERVFGEQIININGVYLTGKMLYAILVRFIDESKNNLLEFFKKIVSAFIKEHETIYSVINDKYKSNLDNI
jgi:hypothetical protein